MKEKHLTLLKKLLNDSSDRISQQLKINTKQLLSRFILGNEIASHEEHDD